MIEEQTVRKRADGNLLCVTAFVSVTRNVVLAGHGRAAGCDDAGQAGPVIVYPFGMTALTQVPAFDQGSDTIPQRLQAFALEKAAAQLPGELINSALIEL